MQIDYPIYKAGIELPHKIYEELAFQSALAMGRSAPNPPVAGVLIVRMSSDYALIGGASEKAGKRHAEIVCLSRWRSFCQDNPRAKAPFRLYLSLEPCTHHGRTPPCTQSILAEPLLECVATWEKDPFLKVSGIELLRQNKKRAYFFSIPSASKKKPRSALGQAFLSGFLSRVQGEGPRFHLKAACTKDNVIGLHGSRLPISQEAGLGFTHLLRAKFDAVLVGMGTILSDAPRLDLRPEMLQKGRCLNNFGDKSPSGKRDLLLTSFFSKAPSLSQSICENTKEYQPDRIFLLGRYDIKIHAFLRLQKEVQEQTGKGPVFFVEEQNHSIWQKEIPSLVFSAVLPSLKRKNFCSALKNAMAKRGYNEVLIEGGSGIFCALEAGLGPQDRIYLIRSALEFKEIFSRPCSYRSQDSQGSHFLPEQNLSQLPLERDIVHLPLFMQNANLTGIYQVNKDSIELLDIS